MVKFELKEGQVILFKQEDAKVFQSFLRLGYP